MVEVNPPASTVTIIQDVITNRPSAGIVNRLFYATDENRWYRDDGMTWQKLDTDTVDNKHIPNTISNILTDHNLSNHESLGLKKITIGISSSRPSAGLANELYIETDTNIIYRGTGTSWQEIGRNIGFDFPNTIPKVLTDHNLSNHELLGLKKITIDYSAEKPVSGSANELYIEIDTNIIYRGTGTSWQEIGRNIGFDFPNTISNILTDHNKTNHDNLLIDADTVDGIDIPNTISNILTDHNLSNHESLGLKKITIGISSSRPSAGLANELYIETDTNIIYRGTGTSWQEIGRNIGFDFPNTISNILTDHNKTNHDNLLIDADTVDGIDIPNTISNILTDHNKTNHDNLLIDADTVDGLHASELGGSKSFVDHLPWCLL